MEKPVIRSSAISDAAAFRDIRLEALKNHPESFGSGFTDYDQKPEQYWCERLSYNSAEQAIYFAELSGNLIGMCGIHRNLAPKLQHSATIFGVYVRPAWRGMKISHRMLEACLNWARSYGVVIAKLAVVTTNQPALKCYSDFGFNIYGMEPKALCLDGSFLDEYVMSIDLQ